MSRPHFGKFGGVPFRDDFRPLWVSNRAPHGARSGPLPGSVQLFEGSFLRPSRASFELPYGIASCAYSIGLAGLSKALLEALQGSVWKSWEVRWGMVQFCDHQMLDIIAGVRHSGRKRMTIMLHGFAE